jgi:FAD dependent oxidoreductase TIGR03364
MTYDVAVVGAGIVGLAHALAAARRGKRVVVLDRDARANGASVRNFGFVTVTGQQFPECWARARRSAEVWDQVAAEVGIEVLHRGLMVAARREEALAVLRAFAQHEMGRDCELLAPAAAVERMPALRRDGLAGALWSPHERRVESRTAIPALARWLTARHGVEFRWSTAVHAVRPPRIETGAGTLEAETCIVCPGDDAVTLYRDRLARYGLGRCKLHMLRLQPETPLRLGAAVMSDLGLVRYLGYAELPEAAALLARLRTERAEALANGVHLIAVQSADGSLVVGDSHHYEPTPDPFAPEHVDALILDELEAVLDLGRSRVVERWTGTYAVAPDRQALIDRPDDATRLVVVTSGTGASTAFAIAEETVGGLFASAPSREGVGP